MVWQKKSPLHTSQIFNLKEVGLIVVTKTSLSLKHLNIMIYLKYPLNARDKIPVKVPQIVFLTLSFHKIFVPLNLSFYTISYYSHNHPSNKITKLLSSFTSVHQKIHHQEKIIKYAKINMRYIIFHRKSKITFNYV